MNRGNAVSRIGETRARLCECREESAEFANLQITRSAELRGEENKFLIDLPTGRRARILFR